MSRLWNSNPEADKTWTCGFKNHPLIFERLKKNLSKSSVHEMKVTQEKKLRSLSFTNDFILSPIMEDPPPPASYYTHVGSDFGRRQRAGNKVMLLLVEAHRQPIIQKASVSCSFSPQGTAVGQLSLSSALTARTTCCPSAPLQVALGVCFNVWEKGIWKAK